MYILRFVRISRKFFQNQKQIKITIRLFIASGLTIISSEMGAGLLFLFVSVILCNICTSSSDLSQKLCPVTECINNRNVDDSTAILCNNCLQKVLSNKDVAALLFHEIQRNEINDAKKLADLNVDVLFIILDYLEIGDLLNLLMVYPDKMLRSVATSIYSRKYKDYHIQVTEGFDDFQVKQNPKRIVVGEKVSLLFLFFGHFIENLLIYFPPHIAIQYVNPFGCNTFSKFDLKFINRHLPNLEHLTLHPFDIDNDLVHFENVKSLIWERATSSSIMKLSFSRLTSLKIDQYHRHEYHVWAAFFQNNSNLSELHVTLRDETAYFTLLELTANLPNLSNLTIVDSHEMIYIDVIVQVINAHRNLRYFAFWKCTDVQNEVNTFREQFGNEWTIKSGENGRWFGVELKKNENF